MLLSRLALGVVLAAHAALVAGLVFWSGPLMGLLLSLPLFATLPGLLRSRSYTAGWASMLLVIYVALLLAEATANPQRRAMAHLMSSVAVIDFVSLVLFVRLSARERAARAAQMESSGGAAR